MLDDLRFRFRALFRRRRVDADLDDEIRFHREHQIKQYVEAGLSPDDARRRLELEFGGVDLVKEECRDARGVDLVVQARQDAKYAWRMLLKSPGFSAIAVCTLALGVGANTAIFSVVYDTLLRPLPYRDASRVVVINETTPRVGLVSPSYPNFADWRAQSHSFAGLSMVRSLSANLSGSGEPESVSMEAVSTNFLSMMGIRPVRGRDFTAAEDAPGTAPIVIITHALWRTHFGGDEHIVGRTISLAGTSFADNTPFTIVGVLPADFRPLDDDTDLLLPMGAVMNGDDSFQDRGERGDQIAVGRLTDGVPLDGARAEMDAIAARLAKTYAVTNDQFGVALRPIRDVFVGDVRSALLILLGAATCVLLIACANVANLVLIRGAGRQREIALRIALGASRGRIVRQLLTESAVLAALGVGAGLGVAIAGLRALAVMTSTDMATPMTASLNLAVLLFAGLVAIVATLLVGVAPALQSTRTAPQIDLRDGGRTSAGTRQRRWRAVLATVEIALALVLLIGAALMMKSVSRLLAVDGGFRTDHLLTMSLELRGDRYEHVETVRDFWQSLVEQTRAIPGVDDAAAGTGVPLTDDHSRSDVNLEGMPPVSQGSYPHPDVHRVSPGYVRTLGIAVLHGRDFLDQDTERSPRVAMINQNLAAKYFPGQDAVGRRLVFGRKAPANADNWITIVGVVADTRLYGLDNPSRLEVYLPIRQNAPAHETLIVKSAQAPETLARSIRSVVQRIDPTQPVSNVRTLNELRTQSMSTRRTTLALLGVFSALAVLLAAIGIYGVMSYTVTLRTHELGVRLALGAARSHVLGTILGQGVTLALVGIGVGLVAAFGVTRLMATLLFQVSAVDPWIFGGVAGALAVVALVACYIPAHRTLGVDPLIALRHE